MSLSLISNYCAASSYFVMIIIMLLVPRPKGDQWHHFNKAANTLLIAYFVLMCSSISGALHLSETNQLTRAIILAVASYQACFFTFTSLSFIQPLRVTRTQVFSFLAIITIASVGLIMLSRTTSLENFNKIIIAFIILYLIMCAYFSYWFLTYRSNCIKRLEEIYAEEMDSRISWITRLFFVSLFVGLLAATEAIFSQFEDYYTLVYIVFYAYFVGSLFRYQFLANYLLRAVCVETENATESDIEEEIKAEPVDFSNTPRAQQLTIALDKWVKDKEYTKADVTVADIAIQLGTSYGFLASYFSTVMNTSFRTWRLNLRIEEAKRLMLERPDLSISEIIPQVGYNQRGNFYRHFQSVVGCSPNEFRDKNSDK